jgi:hypothetical protein
MNAALITAIASGVVSIISAVTALVVAFKANGKVNAMNAEAKK